MKSNKVGDDSREDVPLQKCGFVNEGATVPEDKPSVAGQRSTNETREIASVGAFTKAKISSNDWRDIGTSQMKPRSRSKRSRQQTPFNMSDTMNGREYAQASLCDIEDDEETLQDAYEDGTIKPQKSSSKAANVDTRSKAFFRYFAKVILVITMFWQFVHRVTQISYPCTKKSLC